ncbi:hypothetical protein P3X46_003905 [Hevea brasiliensis]|uniref:PGG domain-containing protein n=1 Tax=Hevea brasiliensis TaxID=3981 RepID=A0ABQ9N7Q1_HEVBR|nr:hypothetical protein P3X46_003905 [Hevea brasiliensis]
MSNPIIAPGKRFNSFKNIWTSWFKHFRYDEANDSPSDVRNILLLITALISTVTFQAGVNPPGGVWQDDKDHHAGRAIYASQKHAFYVFLVFNTLALSTSIHVILYLSYKFPLHFEIWVATASVIVTYGSAIFAVTPHESVKFRYVLLTATLPLAVRFTIQTFKRLKREAHEPVSGVEQEE